MEPPKIISKCVLCGKTFKRVFDLNRHKNKKVSCTQVAETVEDKTCDVCGKEFSTKGNAQRHERKCMLRMGDREEIKRLKETCKKLEEVCKKLQDKQDHIEKMVADGCVTKNMVGDNTNYINNINNNVSNNINNTINNTIVIAVNDIDKIDLKKVILKVSDFDGTHEFMSVVAEKILCDPNTPENSALCPSENGNLYVRENGAWCERRRDDPTVVSRVGKLVAIVLDDHFGRDEFSRKNILDALNNRIINYFSDTPRISADMIWCVVLRHEGSLKYIKSSSNRADNIDGLALIAAMKIN